MAEYRPTYNERKDAFRRKEFADETATTLQSILTPLKVAESVLGLQAQEAALRQQEVTTQKSVLDLQRANDALRKEAESDRAFRDEWTKITGGLGPAEESMEAKKARVAAILEFDKAKKTDERWVHSTSLAQKEAELLHGAQLHSGLDDEDFAVPERRARALYDYQLKDVRGMGLSDNEIWALPVGGGRTAGDLLNDGLNYSRNGRILGGVMDQISAAAKQAAEAKKVDRAVGADVKLIEERERIQQKPEIRAERETKEAIDRRIRIRESVDRALGFNKLVVDVPGSPEYEKLANEMVAAYEKYAGSSSAAPKASPQAKAPVDPRIDLAKKALTDPRATEVHKQKARQILDAAGVTY